VVEWPEAVSRPNRDLSTGNWKLAPTARWVSIRRGRRTEDRRV